MTERAAHLVDEVFPDVAVTCVCVETDGLADDILSPPKRLSQ